MVVLRVALAAAFTILATHAEATEVAARRVGVAVPFIENQGQLADTSIRFHASTLGGQLLVGADGKLTYTLRLPDGQSAVIGEAFAPAGLEPKGTAPSKTRVSFFRGQDPTAWHSRVPTWEAVSLGSIADGVSLELRASRDNVEKIFRLAPGAQPSSIAVQLTGARGVSLGDQGELVVETGQGRVSFTPPLAYHEIDGDSRFVEAHYALLGEERYGFELGPYDTSHALVIDPLLASTYIGSYSNDYGTAVAVDAAGYVYVAGGSRRDALGRYYPTTAGVYQPIHSDDGGGYDVVVSKLDASLENLIASTFIGGGSSELANAIEIVPGDPETLVVVGRTSSSDFPTTPGAFDQTHNGSSDVFVLRMDTDLASLLGSTYVGGYSVEGAFETNTDRGPAMAVDASGNIYVGGTTASGDFPTTPATASYTAFQSEHHGDDEAFLFRLSGDLTTLLAGTFLGGSRNERGTGIALDSAGRVFITGHTESTDDDVTWRLPYAFPTTPGAYDRSFNSDGGVLHEDGFVSRFDADLSTLEASTFIGGSRFEHVWSIAVDPADGSAYIGGVTQSSDYPTTPGAWDETSNSGFDGFISKLDNDLTSLVAGTRLGGMGSTYIRALEVDLYGQLWASGMTSADDFPNFEDTQDPAWSTYANATYFTYDDVFLSELEPDLSLVSRSIHMSGSYDQSAWDMFVDWRGYYYPGDATPTIPEGEPTIYLAGTGEQGGTSARFFYTTPSAWDRVSYGHDVVVTIFGYVPEPSGWLGAAAALASLAGLRELRMRRS